MRIIPLDISNKLHSRIQTLANKCNPVLDARICRPETPLVNEVYLERQTVLEGVNATDVSVAVTHPSFGYNYANTKIFLAYISGGVLRVQTAAGKIRMQNHVWSDMGIEIPASACSIVLDGTMPKNTKGEVEFITEPDPWLFWVYNSVLYGQKVNGGEPVVLAETNCTDVSAVRAMWSSSGGFDFGLVVFFLLSGQLYYRQLIDGEWMDAEVVSFGPDGVTWKEIAAFRTWDYRVGLQAKATDGGVYELFTQFMGVGKQLTEHLVVSVDPKADNIVIDYTTVKNDEHIETRIIPGAKRIYAWSSVPVSATNVDDGTGNYGTVINVVLDYPVTRVDGNSASFLLTDGNGATYTCTNSTSSDDGMTLVLTFVDFNQAEGTTLTISYVPGTIMSPATALEAFSFTFTPENLEAMDIPAPEPIEAWNVDSEGTEIALRFSQPLIGDITGYETPVGYTQRNVDLSRATVTTLNQYSASYTGAKVVDGSTSTYWRGTTAVNWIQFQLAEAKAVTKLRMYMGSYYIETFTVSGSNDGATWVQIGGTYTGASSTTAKWYDFTLDNKTEYLYYRIDTLTAYSTRIYLYEVELQETVAVGNETKVAVAGKTYEYVPGGGLKTENRMVSEIVTDPDDNAVVHLKFAEGNVNSIRNMVGNISVAYSGGTWRGLGGPVADFDFEFTPNNLEPKNHPHDAEHVAVNVNVSATLTRIYYTDASETEHIEVAVNPVANLISVDDI